MEVASDNYNLLEDLAKYDPQPLPIKNNYFPLLLFIIIIVVILIIAGFYIWILFYDDSKGFEGSCSSNNVCREGLYCSGDLTCQVRTTTLPRAENDLCRENIDCQFPLKCVSGTCQK